jgi:hypothetical protein
MASGVAVLFIAALSPVVIFASLRFAQAGTVARGMTGAAVSFLPATRALGQLDVSPGRSLKPRDTTSAHPSLVFGHASDAFTSARQRTWPSLSAPWRARGNGGACP